MARYTGSHRSPGRKPLRPPRSVKQYERWLIIGAAVLAAAGLIGVGIAGMHDDHKDLVIGKYEATSTSSAPQPTVTLPPPDLGGGTTIPAPRASAAMLSANGQAYGPAIPFNSTIPIKDGLVFFLVLGSDARPGQDLHKTRTDSIHIVAIDPASKSGTVVGIPRDTFVDMPGHGQHKINEALERGGPSLMIETIRNFTGLPIEYYVITAFQGFSEMVDELGGVDVYVPRNMSDAYSGAYFEQGYHHFNGEQALAFCRDRHDVPYSDFSRSLNQGSLLLATLGKMRSEVGNDEGLRRWLGVLAEHAEIDVPTSELDGLAALARRTAPGALNNVVMPGKTGSGPGGQSVVYAAGNAADMWNDLRDDARINGFTPSDEPTDTTPTTEETTTTTDGGLLGGIGGGGDETTTTTASP